MTDDELKRLFDEMRGHLDVSLEDVRGEIRNVAVSLEDARGETRLVAKSLEDARDEIHLGTVSLEDARGEIRLVAESVVNVSEKLDRTAARLDDKIEKTAAETQAMIKFSHVELDRRVRALEETQRTFEEELADLQTRVERLEGSTH